MLKKKNYCITAQNAPAHELIGLQAVVSESTDKSRIGMQGKIIDETKNLFIVETQKGEKKLPKREVKLTIEIGKENVLLDCGKLQQRPEDRAKYWAGKKMKKCCEIEKEI